MGEESLIRVQLFSCTNDCTSRPVIPGQSRQLVVRRMHRIALKKYLSPALLMRWSRVRLGKDKIKEHFKQILDSAQSIQVHLMSDKTDSSGYLAFDSGTYEETLGGGGATLLGNSTAFGNSTILGGGQRKIQGCYLVGAKRLAGKWFISQHAITEKPQPVGGR